MEVLARKDRAGSVIMVVDRGVGMNDAQLAVANERIRSAAHDTETPSEFLGHYVVGRLAARHGVVVELTHGESSGTVATVLLPTGAVVPGADELVEEFASAVAASTPPTPIEPPVAAPVSSADTIAEQPTRVPAAAAVVAGVIEATTPPAAPPSFDVVESEVAARSLDAIPRSAPTVPVPEAPAPQSVAPLDLAPADVVAPTSPQLSPPPAVPTAVTPPPVSAPVAAALPESASSANVAEPAAVPAASPPTAREQLLADLAVAPVSAAPMSASIPVGLAAPVATPRSVITPNADLASAQTSANEAVGAALSMFGAERRTPGANLPNTSLVSSLAGVMSLDTASSAPTATAAPTTRTPSAADPDEIRSQLAGFQSGTRRADQED